ncbi:MAG: FxsA family protein [Victivallales bacterium]|nr:FxsA family protein [Victivallales bacterium]
MNLFGWLLCLFIGVPLAEWYCFLTLGAKLGFLPTIAIILVTGFVGAALAHKEGIIAWHRVRQALAAGKDPSKELLNALIIFAAGICLFIPGFVTDVVGILLMLPPVRILVVLWLRKHLHFQHRDVSPSTRNPFPSSSQDDKDDDNDGPPASDVVIDIEATERK